MVNKKIGKSLKDCISAHVPHGKIEYFTKMLGDLRDAHLSDGHNADSAKISSVLNAISALEHDRNEVYALVAEKLGHTGGEQQSKLSDNGEKKSLTPEETGDSASKDSSKQPSKVDDNSRSLDRNGDKEKIEDFGEKIGGARKDTARRGPKKESVKNEKNGPPWRNRFRVFENGVNQGEWTVVDTKAKSRFGSTMSQKFATKEEAEAAVPLFAIAQSHTVSFDRESPKEYAIYKNVGPRKLFKVVNKTFSSRESATIYMARHAEEILNVKTTFGEEILPAPEIAIRKGAERRTKDAGRKMFEDTFAPRGIEFGNWNNHDDRQQVMNHAYDGLLDLAEVLGLPPKALMLDGELAIAFGARGQGLVGAKAHYEDDYGVINLTKMKGSGSLAHEWFHALDHYLARKDGKSPSERIQNTKGDFVFDVNATRNTFQSHGESYKSDLRKDLQVKFRSVIETMYKKAENYVEDTKIAEKFIGKAREQLRESLDSVREYLATDQTKIYTYRKSKRGLGPASSEQLAEFDSLSNILLEGGNLETKWVLNNQEKSSRPLSHSGRFTNETLDTMNAIYKDVRGRTGFGSSKLTGPLDRISSAMRIYAGRLKLYEDAKGAVEKTKTVPTSYLIEAKKMDQARSSDYWTSPHEMAARAFAAYIEDKIAEGGGQSDFMVYRAHGGILLPMIDGFIARPYPEGKEREAINAAFDDFARELKTKETEKGVALYSKNQRTRATSTGNSIANVESELRDFIGRGYDNLVKRGKLEVVRTEAGLPEGVMPIHAKDGTIAGAYDPKTGKVYLVADAIKSGEAAHVFLHEAAHALLHEDSKFQSARDKIMSDFERLGSIPGSKISDAISRIPEDTGLRDGETYNTLSPERKIEVDGIRQEEALSYFLQSNPQHSLFKRVVAAVKAALFRMGIPVGKLNDADLVALFKQGTKSWANKESVSTLLDANKSNAGDYASVLKSQIEAAKAIYSKLVEVSRLQFIGMKAQGVMNFLNKHGVKKEEMIAAGLPEWLAGKKTTDKVTAQELKDFVKANAVELKDVVLGEKDEEYKSMMKEVMDNVVHLDGIGHFDKSLLTDSERKRFNEIDGFARDGNLEGDEIEDWKRLSEKAKASPERARLQAQGWSGRGAETHFSEYTEPGSIEGSYREMFVTVPENQTDKARQLVEFKKYQSELRDKYGSDSSILDKATSEEISKLDSLGLSTQTKWQDGHSQYSDIKNPIVRIRFNEVNADGKRILRIEEMQGPSASNQQKMPGYLKNNIYQLGTKRIISYAKENGFDGVSFSAKPGMSAGETQADRYSLSKQISRIESRDNGNGTYDIDAFSIGRGKIVEKTGLRKSELEENVGKEMARKIANGEGEPSGPGNKWREFKGLDLKVGGEGLKTLYDDQLPKMLEAYGKGKMVDGVLPITDTTPGSFPLFSKNNISSPSKRLRDAVSRIASTAAFKRWFGNSRITSGGQPHVLYHGTSHPQFLSDTNYEWKFDTNRTPSRISSPFAALGIFLGDESTAMAYTDGDPNKVHPFFVRIENPLVTTSEALEKRAYDYESAKAYRKRLMELDGHDGIIIKDRGQAIAFEPNQLKSVTSNSGEFSRENDDVRFSMSQPTSLESVQDVAKGFTDKWSAVWKESGKQDTSIVSRIFQTPEYYFKKVAALGRVLKAAIGRRDLRHNYETKILGKEFIKHVSELEKTDKDSYELANDYLVNTDQTKHAFSMKNLEREWAVYDRDGNKIGTFDDEKKAISAMEMAEYDDLIEKGYSEGAAKSVLLARKVLNAEFDMRVADMRKIQQEAERNGLPDPFISDEATDKAGAFGIYADGKEKPIALFDTLEKANDAISNLAELKSFTVVRAKGGEHHFMTELRAKEWAKKHGGTVGSRLKFGNLTVKRRGEKEMRPMTLSQAIAQMGDLRGSYFPRIRQSGEYVLIATKDGMSPRREHFDIPVAGEAQGLKGAVANWSMAQVGRVFPNAAKRMQELKDEGYTVEFKKDDKPVDEVFDASKLIASIDAIIADNLGAINKNNSDEVNAALHVDSLLTMQIADIFKGRGALSSRMQRKAGDTVWEGYETDMLKAVVQSARDTAAGIAKRDTTKAMLNAFTGRDFSWQDYKDQQKEQGLKPDYQEYIDIINDRRVDPGKQKNAYRDGRAFIVDVLRNSDQADRIMGTMQGLAVLKFLGFRVSSAAVNITNMVTGVPATISGHTGESLTKAFARIGSSASSYGKFKSGKGDVSTEDRNIYQYIVANGWDEAQFNHEAASVLMSKVGNTWNKFTTASMWLFGEVEKVNRATTIMAAYKSIMEKNPGMKFEAAMDEAHHISDRAHGVYGKETLPAWARGRMNPLRLTYTFQKFSHNYMMNMIDLGWTKKQYKAAAYMLLSPSILGGAGASLAGPALFALAGAVGGGGDDPEEEFYKWAADTFGSDTFARHGLAGMAGVNLKGSLQVNVPMPTDIGKMKIADLAGPAGGVITDIAKGMSHFGKGEVSKGAEILLPTAFGSMFKAVREWQEGISTGNYGTVFYGDEPLKADSVDAMLRFFSFNPSRISGVREKQWNEKQVATKYQERKNEIYSELKRLHLQGEPYLTPETLKEVSRYNDMAKGSGRRDIKPITVQGIHLMLRRNDRPSKFEKRRAVAEME